MKNLKKAREDKGLTQEQLAEKLDVSRMSIFRWENNHSYPPISTMLRISEVLEVSVDYLLGRE